MVASAEEEVLQMAFLMGKRDKEIDVLFFHRLHDYVRQTEPPGSAGREENKKRTFLV
jgi:hypothetical protein